MAEPFRRVYEQELRDALTAAADERGPDGRARFTQRRLAEIAKAGELPGYSKRAPANLVGATVGRLVSEERERRERDALPPIAQQPPAVAAELLTRRLCSVAQTELDRVQAAQRRATRPLEADQLKGTLDLVERCGKLVRQLPGRPVGDVTPGPGRPVTDPDERAFYERLAKSASNTKPAAQNGAGGQMRKAREGEG